MKNKPSISFTLADVFPDKPGIFPKDIEREYDNFVKGRRAKCNESLASWKRHTALKTARRQRDDR